MKAIAILAAVTVAATSAFALMPTGASSAAREEIDKKILHAPHILQIATTEMLAEQHRVPLKDLDAQYDRREFLRYLVQRVTAGARSDEERAIVWTRWLQSYFAHPYVAPLDEEGMAIFDPIWLLQHRVAHCGQTNRLVVDGLNLIGIKGRVLQLRNHVAAEAYFDGAWHFLDADLLDFGSFVRGPDGTIPSALEIAADRSLLDRVISMKEAASYPPHRPESASPASPSSTESPEHMLRHTFIPWKDPGSGLTTPFTWTKTATARQEQNAYYGWNHYRAEAITP